MRRPLPQAELKMSGRQAGLSFMLAVRALLRYLLTHAHEHIKPGLTAQATHMLKNAGEKADEIKDTTWLWRNHLTADLRTAVSVGTIEDHIEDLVKTAQLRYTELDGNNKQRVTKALDHACTIALQSFKLMPTRRRDEVRGRLPSGSLPPPCRRARGCVRVRVR